jgi:hypothetical protein
MFLFGLITSVCCYGRRSSPADNSHLWKPADGIEIEIEGVEIQNKRMWQTTLESEARIIEWELARIVNIDQRRVNPFGIVCLQLADLSSLLVDKCERMMDRGR